MAINLDLIVLDSGSHSDPEAGVCLLEAVAWVAGEPHSDHPACVCPVLAAFGRRLNDTLPHDRRQELRPLITLLPGTAGDSHAEERAFMAMDWIVRTYTPTWMKLAGLVQEAQDLLDVPAVTSTETLTSAIEPLRAAAAAGAAARDAAGAAVWAAARPTLQPTVFDLQTSGINLFRNMITIGEAA